MINTQLVSAYLYSREKEKKRLLLPLTKSLAKLLLMSPKRKVKDTRQRIKLIEKSD